MEPTRELNSLDIHFVQFYSIFELEIHEVLIFILPCTTGDEMLDTLSAPPACLLPRLYSASLPSMVSREALSESQNLIRDSPSESCHSSGQKVCSLHISCSWVFSGTCGIHAALLCVVCRCVCW